MKELRPASWILRCFTCLLPANMPIGQPQDCSYNYLEKRFCACLTIKTCIHFALCDCFKIEICFIFIFFFGASYIVLVWDWKNENPWGTLETSAAQRVGAWKALSFLFVCPFKMLFNTFKIKTHIPLFPVCCGNGRHSSVDSSSQFLVMFGKNLMASPFR